MTKRDTKKDMIKLVSRLNNADAQKILAFAAGLEAGRKINKEFQLEHIKKSLTKQSI